jgi:hypothetical protein
VRGFPTQRCNRGTGPSFNASEQNGFWLVRPNMTTSPAWDRLAAVISGAAPPPPPPLPPAWRRLDNHDVTGNAGGAVVPINSTDATACEMPCLADELCTAVVYSSGVCYIKYGAGTPTPKTGPVLLVLE